MVKCSTSALPRALSGQCGRRGSELCYPIAPGNAAKPGWATQGRTLLPPFLAVEEEPPLDAELMKIETQVRAAIRDTVNRASRKPFYWGGLKGYQQLEAIADVLHPMEGTSLENEFFQRLILQVDRTLAHNQALAAELEQAHTWLRKVATCLRYPPTSYSEAEWQMINSQQVADDMENLLEQLRPETENKSILSRFHHALCKC